MTEGVPAEVLALLAREHVLTLATQDAAGPWAAPVFYALDGEDLLFVSSPRARHSAALAEGSRCAGAVHAPAAAWQQIAGVQLAGSVRQLEGEEAETARAVYTRRFPFVAEGDPALVAALARSAWYRLRIDEAVRVDNTRGLGQRERWQRGIAPA